MKMSKRLLLFFLPATRLSLISDKQEGGRGGSAVHQMYDGKCCSQD